MRNIKISEERLEVESRFWGLTRSQERTEEAGKPGEVFPEGGRFRWIICYRQATRRKREATDVKLQQEVWWRLLHVEG